MRLEKLQLTDFRNYQSAEMQLQSPRVVLLGHNAQGKSNLLEAITYLAFGRSLRAGRDLEVIRHQAAEAIIRSQWQRSTGTMSIDLLLRSVGRRSIRVDGDYQRRLGDLLGRVRLVYFSAEDLAFVKGAPAERRRYLDLILYQLYPAYYTEWLHYQKVLGQRNAWLRRLAIAHHRDGQSLQEVWSEQLVEAALPIMRRRCELVALLRAPAARCQLRISGGRECLTLDYRSNVPALAADGTWVPDAARAALRDQLQRAYHAERSRGQTLVGPHRDDLAILLDGQDARTYASQGQQRTIVLALKLAELETLWVHGEPPVLLLDDVLAELDVQRQKSLLRALADQVQTFVTTTHLQGFAHDWLANADLYHVRAGQLGRG